MTDLILKERRAEWSLRRQQKVLEDMERKREGLQRSLSVMQRYGLSFEIHVYNPFIYSLLSLLTRLQTSETEHQEDLNEWKRNTAMLQQKGQEYEERLEQLDVRFLFLHSVRTQTASYTYL